GTATGTHAGWTAGAGSEWVLSGNLTAKLEYLFVDLGSFGNTFAATGVVPTVVTSSHVRDNIVRIGLNYRFSGPVVANYSGATGKPGGNGSLGGCGATRRRGI